MLIYFKQKLRYSSIWLACVQIGIVLFAIILFISNRQTSLTYVEPNVKTSKNDKASQDCDCDAQSMINLDIKNENEKGKIETEKESAMYKLPPILTNDKLDIEIKVENELWNRAENGLDGLPNESESGVAEKAGQHCK